MLILKGLSMDRVNIEELIGTRMEDVLCEHRADYSKVLVASADIPYGGITFRVEYQRGACTEWESSEYTALKDAVEHYNRIE